MNHTIRRIRVAMLAPHPQNKAIYGSSVDDDLVASIAEHGILEPLVVTAKRIVISGHRRLAAAKTLGLKTVPARQVCFDDETYALVEFNRARTKTWSDRYRELQVLLPRLRADANDRRQIGARRGAARRHGLPETHLGRKHGRSRVFDDAAKLTGLSREKIRKLIRVKEAIESGMASVSISRRLDAGEITVHQAYLMVKRTDADAKSRAAIQKDIAAGRCNIDGIIQPFDVWQFPKRDRRFDLPGLESGLPAPAQIWVNAIHYYSNENDLVIDPMAGTGTVKRVAEWMGRCCEAFDISPRGSDIRRHDLMKGFPYKNDRPRLVVLDPPYFTQQTYSRARNDLSRAATLRSFLKQLDFAIVACLDALSADGHLALLMGNCMCGGQVVDVDLVWEATKLLDHRGTLVRRIAVPYTQSQHAGFRIANARSNRAMLSLTRELLIAKPR